MKALHCGLAKKKCLPCAGQSSLLRYEELEPLLQELGGGWRIERGHHLEKEYIFPDFRWALAFTNFVGELGEREGHHPDIYLSWGKVKLCLWTHQLEGLTESDFILAAKCDIEHNKVNLTERACF